MPVFDFSTVKELEALDADTYRCIIADTPKKAGPKGDYYAVKFTVKDEDVDESINGRALYRNYSLSPASLFAIKRFMIAAGADPEIFQGPVDTDEVMAELHGAEVDVTVIVKDYTGDDGVTRQVNEVTKVTAPGI